MPESITVSALIPAKPGTVYKAWMDSEGHTNITGSEAHIEPKIGGRFTAWEGYIEGTTLELEPGRRIVQAWRTTDFPPNSPDSRLEILFEESKGITKITLTHTNIPDGQGDEYKQGWLEFYFEPMAEFFESFI